MKFYLVDYENTQVHGLKGLDKLTSSDRVIIFYSENAKSISFDSMHEVLKTNAKVSFEHIEAGRENALDFQLTSYLGYLMRAHPFSEFCVVSKDKGYNCLVDFWQSKGKKLTLIHNIAGEIFDLEPKPRKQFRYAKPGKYQSYKADRTNQQKDKTPSAPVKETEQKKEPANKKSDSVSKVSRTQEKTVKASRSVSQPETRKPQESKPKTEKTDSVKKAKEIEKPVENVPQNPDLKKQDENLLAYAPITPPVKKAEDQPIGLPKDEPLEVKESVISEPEKTADSTEKKPQNRQKQKNSKNKVQVRKLKNEGTQSKPSSDSSENKPELHQTVHGLLGDRHDAEIVTEIITTYGSKQEVHNELQRRFNQDGDNNRATEIYAKIKPLLKKHK